MRCANLEQLSLVLQFVDSEMQIREEFLDFITVERITRESLSTTILERLQKWGLDIRNCRGQGYDSSSNMSSSHTGVQGRICAVAQIRKFSFSFLYSLPGTSVEFLRG